ncbi:MAG: twin-arginine translocase TatA/TatE family subunit [Bacillota bacterium]|nr:twin-arginine translocase TatA/TatE family subunit [Clostridia bacterium]
MPSLGLPELILILVIALIVFGPGKLPSVGASVGRAINEFKKASREIISDAHESNSEDKPPTKENKN